ESLSAAPLRLEILIHSCQCSASRAVSALSSFRWRLVDRRRARRGPLPRQHSDDLCRGRRDVLCGWLPHCKAKLMYWHWSGAVFCPACRCSRLRLLALMEFANRVPFCVSGFDALDITWVVPIPGLTGLPSHRIALATSCR